MRCWPGWRRPSARWRPSGWRGSRRPSCARCWSIWFADPAAIPASELGEGAEAHRVAIASWLPAGMAFTDPALAPPPDSACHGDEEEAGEDDAHDDGNPFGDLDEGLDEEMLALAAE